MVESPASPAHWPSAKTHLAIPRQNRTQLLGFPIRTAACRSNSHRGRSSALRSRSATQSVPCCDRRLVRPKKLPGCRPTPIWDVRTSFNPKNVLGPISKNCCPPTPHLSSTAARRSLPLKRPGGPIREIRAFITDQCLAAVSEIPCPSVAPKFDAPGGAV